MPTAKRSFLPRLKVFTCDDCGKRVRGKPSPAQPGDLGSLICNPCRENRATSSAFLGTMQVGNYTWATVGATKAEALAALGEEWARSSFRHHVGLNPETGRTWTFDDWFEYVGGSVDQMFYGKVLYR